MTTYKIAGKMLVELALDAQDKRRREVLRAVAGAALFSRHAISFA